MRKKPRLLRANDAGRESTLWSMILSSGSLAAWLALGALVGYGVAAWPMREGARIDAIAFGVGWVLHGLE